MTETRQNESEASRLKRFWNERYQEFSLNESGIKGLDAAYIQLLYRCKLEAWRAALGRTPLRGRTGLRALDAGCGQGFFCKAAERDLPDIVYTGADISEKAVAFLSNSMPGHRWLCGDFCDECFPVQPPYDLIQSIEVLHLILDDEHQAAAIRNFARWLAPDGRIIITDTCPRERYQANPYIVFRPRSHYKALAERYGLRIESIQPMYYFVPSRGWTVWPVNRIFARLPPLLVYRLDRMARALRLPQFWTTHDSRMKIITLCHK
jgi:SAM-dependent methyltransferase